MPKTQFNVEQFRSEAVKPLFAVAGAADLAVDFARGYASEAQKSAQERLDAAQARVTKVDFRDTRALQAQAREVVASRVEELTKDAKDAQARFEARIAELQQDAKDFPAKVQRQLEDAVRELSETYADLASRGEKFVAAIRKDGVRAVTAKPARKTTAKKASAPVKKTTAKKAPARKTAAKKAPARKTTAKKAPARKTAAKSAAAKRTTANTTDARTTA